MFRGGLQAGARCPMKEAFDFRPGTSSALKSAVAWASAVKVSGASPPDLASVVLVSGSGPSVKLTEARPEASVVAMVVERFPPPAVTAKKDGGAREHIPVLIPHFNLQRDLKQRACSCFLSIAGDAA